MVSSIWATLSSGQTYPHRPLQPNSSHPVYERGSSCNCEKQSLFDHFSLRHQVQKWTTASLQKAFSLHFLLLVSFQGFGHLALQSRLPIVPIVLTGTHRAWRKGSLHVRPAPITVKYLPPIDTNEWSADKLDDYIKMVPEIYAKNLPEPQKPLALDNTRSCSNS